MTEQQINEGAQNAAELCTFLATAAKNFGSVAPSVSALDIAVGVQLFVRDLDRVSPGLLRTIAALLAKDAANRP